MAAAVSRLPPCLTRLLRRSEHEILAPVALRIKKRGQIAVIDPRMSGGRDLGFGVKGNAEPRGFEHREIVGAVANRKNLLDGEVMLVA
jgi:hypothetical protein